MGFNSYMHLELWHIIQCPEKETEKNEQAKKKGQEITSLARKNLKKCIKLHIRDTSASSYFFSLHNSSVVVEKNAKYPALNFKKRIKTFQNIQFQSRCLCQCDMSPLFSQSLVLSQICFGAVYAVTTFPAPSRLPTQSVPHTVPPISMTCQLAISNESNIS